MRASLSQFVLLVALGLCGVPFAAPAAESLDRIVAVVNEQVVLASELDAAISDVKRQLTAQGIALPAADALKKQVLERLILVRLQTQRATHLGLQATDADINKALESIAARNEMTMDGLRQAMHEDGLDYATYREQLRDEILMARLRQREVDNRISISEQDIDLFLEVENRNPSERKDYRLRHILLVLPADPTPDAVSKKREEARSLLAQLRGGADFAQLAITRSNGQQALQGGDLGWIAGDVLPTVFADIVPRLKPGELSPVLESESGFHIVRLEDARGAATDDATAQEVHLRHILIRAGKRSPDQAHALIEELRERLSKGEDFGALAERYSEDPGSKNSGGDLDWQRPANFDPEFRRQALALKDNQTSAAFESSFGWHIVQMLGRRTASNVEGNSLRDRVRASLYQRRSAEEYETWLRRLRDEAYVEIRLPGAAASATAS